jgi:hypothetical protein
MLPTYGRIGDIPRPSGRGAIMLATAVSSGAAATILDGPFAVVGGIAASVTLIAYLYIEVVKPAWRRHRLQHPCHVWFNIKGTYDGGVPYIAGDGKPHHLKELVLPPNYETEIEIIYLPKLAYFEFSIAFGCELSDDDGKPHAFECFNRFTIPGKGKSHWIPGVDDGHSLNRHKFYTIIRNAPRNTGTHFIVGFKFRTEKVGVFPMKLYFMTNEVEGEADLTVRVEERPTTSMKCCVKQHGECYVYPAVSRDSLDKMTKH